MTHVSKSAKWVELEQLARDLFIAARISCDDVLTPLDVKESFEAAEEFIRERDERKSRK
jgi:hypothetical protein